jgi:hypothetical protein
MASRAATPRSISARPTTSSGITPPARVNGSRPPPTEVLGAEDEEPPTAVVLVD